MWKVLPDSSCTSEPIELRNLKQLLATNKCKCKICIDQISSTIVNNDKETQVKNINPIKIISSDKLQGERSLIKAKTENFCPGCYVALNLLKQKELKYLKDETSETSPYMFSCDKSTDKINLEKSQSSSNNISAPNTEAIYCVSASPTDLLLSKGKCKSKEVNFADFLEDPPQSTYENCLCMENFINSIRPPLINLDI